MTDGQWLFVTFLALYLAESLRWLPPHAVLLVGSGSAGGWRWVRPSATFRFRGRAALFLPLLPPLPAWRITCEWPFIPNAETLDAVAEDRDAPALRVPWTELSPKAEGASIGLTARLLVPTVSEAESQRLTAQLKAWQNLTPAARAEAFGAETAHTLDAESLQATLQEAVLRTRWLRRLGSLIALWCYGVISWLYWRFGESYLLLAGVAVLLGLMLAQGMLFVRACKGRQNRGEPTVPWWRFKTVGILLFPPMAIRAADSLLAMQAPWSHPLACRQLVPEKTWQDAALAIWRSAVYRPHWKSSELGIEAQVWSRFFQDAGVNIDQLNAPPEPQSAAYCPRCRAVFTSAVNECVDCGGVELIGPTEEMPQT